MKKLSKLEQYKRKVGAENVEFASCDPMGVEARAQTLKQVNLFMILDSMGMSTKALSLDEVEAMGLTIPNKPYRSLTEVEKRNLQEGIKKLIIPE